MEREVFKGMTVMEGQWIGRKLVTGSRSVYNAHSKENVVVVEIEADDFVRIVEQLCLASKILLDLANRNPAQRTVPSDLALKLVEHLGYQNPQEFFDTNDPDGESLPN